MKNLFKSKTSYEILELLINNQGKKFYLNEIALAVNKNMANVSRELQDLISANVVSIEKKGVKKYYFFNVNFSAANELIGLVNKSEGLDIEKTFKRGAQARGE
jgi:predicted transcriptional regulator